MQEKEIDGKAIWSYGNSEAEKVLIQLVGEHEISGIEQEFHAIQDRTSEEFYMIAWRVNNWNDELSPWKAPPAFGEEGFGDGASELLEKILEYCSDKSKTYYLGGYSLAGLFGGILPDGPFCGNCSSLTVSMVSRLFGIYARK